MGMVVIGLSAAFGLPLEVVSIAICWGCGRAKVALLPGLHYTNRRPCCMYLRGACTVLRVARAKRLLLLLVRWGHLRRALGLRGHAARTASSTTPCPASQRWPRAHTAAAPLVHLSTVWHMGVGMVEHVHAVHLLLQRVEPAGHVCQCGEYLVLHRAHVLLRQAHLDRCQHPRAPEAPPAPLH